jgi:hypothetical protein
LATSQESVGWGFRTDFEGGNRGLVRWIFPASFKARDKQIEKVIVIVDSGEQSGV